MSGRLQAKTCPRDRRLTYLVDFKRRKRRPEANGCQFCGRPVYNFFCVAPEESYLSPLEGYNWGDHATAEERKACDMLVEITKGARA